MFEGLEEAGKTGVEGSQRGPVGHNVWAEGESVRGSAGWHVRLVRASVEAGLGW